MRRTQVGSFNVEIPTSYTDLSNADRCLIGFNAGPPMTPGAYNNNMHLFQTPEYVAIVTEMVHTARIIPIGDEAGSPNAIRQYSGNSRGRWEGDTLVVDVTGFNGLTWLDRAGNFHSEALRVTERYTPISPHHLMYEATLELSLIHI